MAKKSEIDSLKTREQRFKEAKWNRMFVSRSLVQSKAFWALRGSSIKVLFVFLSKCVQKSVQSRPMRREKEWVITNNGEIQFTYIEAKEKWGITNQTFAASIDQLVEVGFIDIAKSGSGLHKDVTLYAISDRWRKYGTDEFVYLQRPKRKVKYGFAKGHRNFSTQLNHS
jgi:hypothetical protein